MLDIEKLTDALLAGVQALVNKQTDALNRQIESLATLGASLEERLKQLEQREPAPVFDPSPIYEQIETLKGGLQVVLPEMPDFESILRDALAGVDPGDSIVNLEKQVAVLQARVDSIKMPDVVHGKDGVGIESAKINHDGELLLKLTNGETLQLGKVQGSDGRDALPIGNVNLAYDGERSIMLYLGDGEKTIKQELILPIPIDRGVYREDTPYRKGDVVTWAGSMWICQLDDPTGKPESSKDWRLSVKRGRDAKPMVKS